VGSLLTAATHPRTSHRCRADELYAEMCCLVSEFGVEDPYGDGDFWVADESFSTETLAAIQYKSRVVVSPIATKARQVPCAISGGGLTHVIDKVVDVPYAAQRENAD